MTFFTERLLPHSEFRPDIAAVIAEQDIVAADPRITRPRMGINQQGGIKIPAANNPKGGGMGPMAGEAHYIRLGVRSLGAGRVKKGGVGFALFKGNELKIGGGKISRQIAGPDVGIVIVTHLAQQTNTVSGRMDKLGMIQGDV